MIKIWYLVLLKILKSMDIAIVNFLKNPLLYLLIPKKKIVDKKNIFKNFYIFDVILIGFNDGIKVISKDMIKIFLKKKKTKTNFFC